MSEVIETWPLDFVRRMQEWLGDEAEEFFAALARRDFGLRLNSTRGPLEVLKAHIPWKTAPIPWCPVGLWLQEEAKVGLHPYHRTGLYYSQDPSAMAAAVLLDPQPGEWVLDLAASPGGKATHIAARMDGKGVLIANEVDRRRASVLAMNIERMGVKNAMVTNETPERLAEHWGAIFDAVLVDAPCSGEGIFARDPRSVRDWSFQTIQANASRQKHIMDDSAALVRPGGRLLYGTCTFAPEENEGIIADFLTQHPDFELLDLPQIPGLYRGRPEWIGASDDLARTGRFWPHKGPGHGHFYALLRRKGEPPTDLPQRWEGSEIPGRVLSLYTEAMQDILKGDVPQAGLMLNKQEQIYITPLDPRMRSGMRILRPGWWVASLRHNKINLDHALAMTLRQEDVHVACGLSLDDVRFSKYMLGGFWPDSGPAGFVLVTIGEFSLGWAKRSGGRLRSRYPVHLRR